MTGEQKHGGLSTTPDLAGLCERLNSHMGKADLQEVLRDCREAAAAIERLVAALASIVDRDLTYDGPCIVIPTKNHGEAISLIASARTALSPQPGPASEGEV